MTILDTSDKWNHAVICPTVTDLCHLAWCPQGSSMLSRMAEFPSFLRLKIFHFMCVPRFLYLFTINGDLGRFRILATMTSTAMIMGVHILIHD